jgi:replicative DNA helicase
MIILRLYGGKVNVWNKAINGNAYGDGGKNMTQKNPTFFKKETLKEILTWYKPRAWPERNIRKETMEYFECRVKVSEIDNSTEKVFFPSYDQSGKLVGFKVKDITKAGEKDEYYTIGKVIKKNQLFGQKKARTNAKYLVITEGESDCLSAYQSMIDYFKSFKDWNENLTPAVVTFSAGAVQAVNHLSHNEKFLKKFQEFRLAMDNDEVSEVEKLTSNTIIRGKECTENIGCYLLTHDSEQGKRDIKVVKLHEDYNDISDYVQAKKGIEVAKQITEKKRLEKFSAEKIISVEDITIDELLKPKEKGIYIDSFPLLMAKLWGIRKRELTVFTALSGTGKTACVSEIGYKIAEQSNEKVALVFLEENSNETLLRMISRRLGINYYKFVFEPLKHCTKKEFIEAYNWVKDKFFFLDVFGAMTQESLINSFKSLYYVSSCKYIIFDHLGMLGGQKGLKDERRMIDEAMTEIASWVSQTDVSIIAVSHLSRLAQQEIGKMSDIKESKWINVRKEHLRGCVDCDTEYLGELGWKKISEYSGEKIFQYNKNRSIEFVQPMNYIVDDCDFFYHFKNSTYTDMVLSPNHRVIWVDERWPEKIKEITAEDMLKKHISLSRGFKGLIPCTFTKSVGKKLLSEELLRVQVAFNADGWHTDYSRMGRVRFKKHRKIQRFLKLIQNSGLRFTWWVNTDATVEFSFIPPMDKGYTNEWYNLDQHSLEVICDEVRYWGCDYRDGRFSSVVKEEADFIQFVYACCGHRSLLRSCENSGICPDGKGGYTTKYNQKIIHHVSKSNNAKFTTWAKTKNSKSTWKKEKPVDGKQYCFTVPSGMFIVRRNGKVFITGNSSSLEQLAWNVIALDMLLEPNRERSDVRLSILKNRSIGFLGVTDQFHLDPETGFIKLTNQQEIQGY